MKYNIENNIKNLFLIFIFTLNTLCLNTISKAKETINTDKIIKKEIIENDKLTLEKDFYILGPGDTLYIKFIGAEELSGRFLILRDGNIQLPLVGTQNLIGLTLDNARNRIIELYRDDLIRPQIDLTLLNARPVRVSLIGEVQRPGSYTLNNGETSRVTNSGSSGTSIAGYQTVVDAIQKAGGLTFDADITKVKIYRKLPKNKGGYKTANLDLLDMIRTGNQLNNPILFDGDKIQINKLQNDKYNLSSIPNNITPENITIHVIGEVASPGKYQVDAKTQISQAILIAGGPNSWRYRDKIQLLRVNRNGTVDVKRISFNKEGLSRNMNKITLRDGDILRVNKNLFSKSADAMSTFLPPIRDLYSLYGVYKLIND